MRIGSQLPPPNIAGYCPMGCGETLHIDGNGRVRCQRLSCGDPTAVARILDNPETEHRVHWHDDGVITVMHPLRERVQGALWRCDLSRALTEYEDATDEGDYRVSRQLDAEGLIYWRWEKIHP
jgi:hypothetical protein